MWVSFYGLMPLVTLYNIQILTCLVTILYSSSVILHHLLLPQHPKSLDPSLNSTPLLVATEQLLVVVVVGVVLERVEMPGKSQSGSK